MFRKVTILLSGSLIAQLLPLLSAPLLTRIYSPEAFGEFGFFVAIASILGALANLKFEHAILIAKNSVVAFHVLLLALISTCFISLTLFLSFLFVPNNVFDSKWFTITESQAILLPIYFLFLGLSNAFSSMLFRSEQFSAVAKSRVSQAFVVTGLMIFFGRIYPGGLTLILSTIVGQSVCILAMLTLRDSKITIATGLRKSLLVRSFKRYKRFPLFTVPSDLLNVLAANVPMIFLSGIHGDAVAGAYTLAQRVLATPLMLLGSAFSDVYRQSASQHFTSFGNYWVICKKTFVTLAGLSVVPMIACIAFAPAFFSLIFGEDWTLAGEIVQILALAYFTKFVVSPLSYNYYLANKHSEDFVLQLLNSTVIAALFFFAQFGDWSIHILLTFYSVNLFLIYVIYGARSLYFAKSASKS